MNYRSGTPVAIGDRAIGWDVNGHFISGSVAAIINTTTIAVRVAALNTTPANTGAVEVCDGVLFKGSAVPALASQMIREDDAGAVLASSGALPTMPTHSTILNQLVAWYSLEEAGTRLDATGGGFHLGEVGGTVGVGGGVVGNAAVFTGPGTARLQHVGAAVLNGSISMALWINQNSVGALNSNWLGQYSGNSARNVIRTETGTGDLTYNGALSAGPLPLGVWTHVAFTCDGTTGKVYVNGALISSGAQTLNYTFVNNICIGAIGSGNNPCDGAVDMAGIWSRELTATEVAALAGSTNPDFPFS